jgi:hypothetical protein
LLHGGQQCRSVVVSDSQFCGHHARLADDHGADVVKRGEHLPARRKRTVQKPAVTEPIVAKGSSAVTFDPASVRPQLAAAAAANLDDIRRVLIETATGANKHLWATISCKHCSRAGRYEITVPDNKVRLDAVQTLLHESLGRPAHVQAALSSFAGSSNVGFMAIRESQVWGSNTAPGSRRTSSPPRRQTLPEHCGCNGKETRRRPPTGTARAGSPSHPARPQLTPPRSRWVPPAS